MEYKNASFSMLKLSTNRSQSQIMSSNSSPFKEERKVILINLKVGNNMKSFFQKMERIRDIIGREGINEELKEILKT